MSLEQYLKQIQSFRPRTTSRLPTRNARSRKEPEIGPASRVIAPASTGGNTVLPERRQ